MEVPYIESLPNGNYYIFYDQSSYNGILHFTHELSVWVCKNGDDILFIQAYEIGCGEDWTYKKDEIELFNQDHPGVMDDIKERLNEYEARKLEQTSHKKKPNRKTKNMDRNDNKNEQTLSHEQDNSKSSLD